MVIVYIVITIKYVLLREDTGENFSLILDKIPSQSRLQFCGSGQQ
jgi:hypothetical protein